MNSKTTRSLAAACAGALLLGACALAIVRDDRCTRLSRAVSAGYEAAFYKLVENVESIEVGLGKLLVAGQGAHASELAADIWQQSYALTENLSDLPLSEENREDMTAFANRLGEYCLAVVRGQGMGGSERANLEALLDACTAISDDVARMREGNTDGGFTGALPLAGMADGKGQYIDGMGAGGVEYPTLIYDGPFSEAAEGEAKALPEGEFDRAQAVLAAIAFIGEERIESIDSTGEELGDIPAWTFAVRLNNGGEQYLAITKRGGSVLWLLSGASPESAGLTLEEAEQYARAVLDAQGYTSMEAAYVGVSGSIALFSYVYRDIEDALYYPDMIKLQISLEDGTLVGFEAGNYIRSHTQRQMPELTASADDAMAQAGSLDNVEMRLCLIPTEGGERWCYQISGDYDGGEYYIYVDVTTGETLQVLKRVETEHGILTI